MSLDNKPVYTGGCQCGAIRFRIEGALGRASICHCRMCQKAAGNIFIALVAAPREAVTWTRGTPARFRSSEHVDRGFCRDCGTPLFYENIEGDRINFTIGSMDHPELFPPHEQDGNEGRVPWFEGLATLKSGGETGSGDEDDAAWAAAIKSTNNQHPDHDTHRWPE